MSAAAAEFVVPCTLKRRAKARAFALRHVSSRDRVWARERLQAWAAGEPAELRAECERFAHVVLTYALFSVRREAGEGGAGPRAGAPASSPIRIVLREPLVSLVGSRLQSLPTELAISGALDCSRSDLRCTPPDFHCSRDLILSGCSRLESLGEGLVVGYGLLLPGCTALRELPDDFYVGIGLNLERCASIRRIPDCVLRWGPTSFDTSHNVYVHGAGLPEAELARLQEADAPHVRFHVSLGTSGAHALGESDTFVSLEAAIAFWTEVAGFEGTLVAQPYVGREHMRGVLLFLAKLKFAKEFQFPETKPGLAKRVVEVLETLCEDAYAREELLARMGDAVDSCHDKPVWALNQMTLVAKVARARGDAAALRALGVGVMRLGVVHEHVERKLAALGVVDDVCVYLRFEIALREELRLPVSGKSMFFPHFVKVSDREILAAKADALLVQQDADAFHDWLSAWPEWRRQQRHERAAALDYDALDLADAGDFRAEPEAEAEAETETEGEADPDGNEQEQEREARETDLLGQAIRDPVVVRGQVWSLSDVKRHWVATGLDLANEPLAGLEHLRRLQVQGS